jgi:sporulation protein YlmC with PRC-barrel domain
MRICALLGMRVFDAQGQLLGRLHELEATDGTVERLVYGKAGFFERMTGRSAPTKRPWSDVAKIDRAGIHLAEGGEQAR